MLQRRPPLARRSRGRGARRRADHAAGLRARATSRRCSRSASSTCSSCCVVATVWGAWLALATARRQRARVQLLPHPADRPLHDRRRARTGSALVVFFVAAVGGQLARRARPPARASRPTSAARRPTCRPRWRGCCCAAGAWRRRCRRSARGSPRRSGCPSAAIELRAVDARRAQRRVRRCARARRQIGTLVLPAGAPEAVLRRVQVRDRAGAGGAAGRGAGARRAAGRGGRDRRAAPQRRDQDRAAALGLATTCARR